MRIVFDCRCVHDHMGGIGQVARDLAKSMAYALRGHKLRILSGPRAPSDFVVPGAEMVPVTGAMIDERFEQLELPAILGTLGADVYINPTFSVPAVKTSRFQVAFVHDLVFEDHPEWVEPGLRDYLRRWSRLSALAADRVITSSDFSIDRIQRVYGVGSDRLVKVAHGLSSEFSRPCDEADVRRVALKHRIASPYVLYLGSLEPKKGIRELLDAFAALVRSGTREVLVLAGEGGAWARDLDGVLDGLGLRDRVLRLGYVDEADRKPLLAGARLFVYPSLYEGFGLPPLEAMALGIPCVTHDGTSLPEVVGDVGLTTDARDVKSFSGALRSGLTDTAFRARAAQAGPARAVSFSWARAASLVLDLCERLEAAA